MERDTKEIEIKDEKGIQVYRSEFKSKIDISTLPIGIYFVKIDKYLQKFIKE